MDTSQKMDTDMIDSSPAVSIIVPVYNAERFLRDCVGSVIGQSFRDWELILVDDQSSDGSLKLARRLAEEHSEYSIRVLSIPHAGVSGARNHGVIHARSPYVLFLDSDDMLQWQALELMMPSASPECIVVGQFQYSKTNQLPEREALSVYGVFSASQAVMMTLYQCPLMHNSPCGIVYPRQFLINEPFVTGRRYEDLEIFSRMYMQARNIVVLENIVVWYRSHKTSFINTLSDSRLDALWATDCLLNRMKRLGNPDLILAAESRRFSAYYNLFALGVKAGDRELQERCLKVIKQYRRQILTDYLVRGKNKTGALLSYLGAPAMRLLSRLVYR